MLPLFMCVGLQLALPACTAHLIFMLRMPIDRYHRLEGKRMHAIDCTASQRGGRGRWRQALAGGSAAAPAAAEAHAMVLCACAAAAAKHAVRRTRSALLPSIIWRFVAECLSE